MRMKENAKKYEEIVSFLDGTNELFKNKSQKGELDSEEKINRFMATTFVMLLTKWG